MAFNYRRKDTTKPKHLYICEYERECPKVLCGHTIPHAKKNDCMGGYCSKIRGYPHCVRIERMRYMYRAEGATRPTDREFDEAKI